MPAKDATLWDENFLYFIPRLLSNIFQNINFEAKTNYECKNLNFN